MVLCSGEPPEGFCDVGFCSSCIAVFVMLVVVLHPLLFLWCCSSFIAVFLMLVVVLHSLLFLWCWLLFFIHYCFCDVFLRSLLFLWCWLLFFIHCFLASSLTLLRAIARNLHPFYTFSPAHRRVICDTFILAFPGPSFAVLLQVLPFWVGIFYLQAFFTLHSFPTFLPQPVFIKASLGAGSSSLKFAGLHADPRNADHAHLFVWFTAIHNLDIHKNSYLNCTKYYHELLVVKSLVYLLLTCFKLF